MRIFLIGFMGSGKTYWARRLSDSLGLPFFDLDTEIVKMEQRSVQQIFHDEGEEYFRIREHEMLEALTEDHRDVIISCGGGTPCFFNNIDLMKRNGKVVWLNTAVDALVQRLQREKNSRPLLARISDGELRDYIIKKQQERRFYYEQADIVVPEDAITLDTLIKIIHDA